MQSGHLVLATRHPPPTFLLLRAPSHSHVINGAEQTQNRRIWFLSLTRASHPLSSELCFKTGKWRSQKQFWDFCWDWGRWRMETLFSLLVSGVCLGPPLAITVPSRGHKHRLQVQGKGVKGQEGESGKGSKARWQFLNTSVRLCHTYR